MNWTGCWPNGRRSRKPHRNRCHPRCRLRSHTCRPPPRTRRRRRLRPALATAARPSHRPAAATDPAAIRTAGAAAAARRELDRQGPRRRRCRGHAHRRRAAPRARRAGRHPAAGNPRRRGRRAGRGARRRRGSAVRPSGRPSRRDRLGRNRRGRGVYRRHRGHDDLRLGVRARRPGDRGGDRRRRAHLGSVLGLSAPRPAGTGAADRAGADRHRWHHDAPDRIHARHLGRIPARPARQGLDLAARRENHRLDLSAARRVGRGPLRRRQRRVAGRCLRHRSRPGHRRRAAPAAVDRQPGRDGAADHGRPSARTVSLGGTRAHGRRLDGRRSGRGAARDRARRGPPARSHQDRPADLVGHLGGVGPDRGDGCLRRRGRCAGPAGDGRRDCHCGASR